ncbi:MAG: NAD(P)H-binding protein [Bacteroidota bacterium]
MKTIVIAGATGFIGRWFIHRYHKEYHIIALSRANVGASAYPEVEWRQVDLYSLSSTTAALKGADYALYLVHSMQPSTRLNQSNFEDTDLLLADNFVRAAELAGLKQIVFIGGILPKDSDDFSTHLKSRYETELTLGSSSVPFTSLRAGIIIGPGGSSFKIVEKLVSRLPVMACPEWCTSPSQPIDIEDMLVIISHCFGKREVFERALEIGGEEVVTYRQILERTAQKMNKSRLIFSIPLFTLGFSKLWVALFSDSSTTFVAPLIESLKHDMRIDPALGQSIVKPKIGIDDSIMRAISEPGPQLKRVSILQKEKNTVRSVQRLKNPGNKSVEWVANAYPAWLTNSFKFVIRAVEVDNELHFRLLGISLLQLKYMPERSDERRRLFFIVGGVLCKRKDYGWLEFRSVLDNQYIIAAIHEFVPSLPWYVYRYTQAVVHLIVMNRFNAFLRRQT